MLWSEGNLMFLNSIYMLNGASQVALVVKNPPSPPANAQVQSLGGGHSNHSSILSWRIPWMREPDGLQFIESQRVRHD